MFITERPLEGRVAIITGAGRGIGREHALAYARAGARVLVNDVGGRGDGAGTSSEPADEVVSQIREMGGEAARSTADVSATSTARELVDQAIDTFGRLDVLINNAGILRDRSLLKMTEEDWDSVVRVHLKGTFLTSQAAGRYWRTESKSGRPVSGRIINTTSGSGLFGNFGQANYAAAKGGIASLTIVTALELGSYGVTANAIAPVAKTRLTATAGMSQDLANGFDPYAPQHIAPFLVWLGSERSGEVTGRLFSVVGGFVGVVEPYNIGPEIYNTQGPLSFEDIDRDLPNVVRRARPRIEPREAHAYGRA